MTPAFLAGAAQDASDCDLRPATLRGLLRWWWRTMHAGHLRSGELAELEALVWGDTESGSPVSISLEPRSRAKPLEYRKSTIMREHKLAAPRGRAIQGLFYTSYGMDEKSSSRRYLDAGARWDLVLTARDGYWRKTETVPAKLMMEQAEAALWLLARFGGAGSKSRKGFGSFTSLDLHSIRSIEDCMENAKRLRVACGLPSSPNRRESKTPALEHRIQTKDIATGWSDPWFALDKVGAVYQGFIKDRCRKEERVAFGLPRRGQKGRYASPVHWSLDRRSNGELLVRLIAFPAPDLLRASKSVLQRLRSHVQVELQSEVRQARGQGQAVAPTQSSPHGHSPQPDLPMVGERVRVRLQQRTKNSWRVETADGSMNGHIANFREMPSELQEGQKGTEVDLLVQRASATGAIFRWPTASDAKKASKSAGAGPSGQRTAGRGRRRKR